MSPHVHVWVHVATMIHASGAVIPHLVPAIVCKCVCGRSLSASQIATMRAEAGL